MVQQVQVLEISFSEFVDSLSVQIVNRLANKEDGHRVANVFGEQLLMDLVINELALLLGTLLVSKLSPASSIANSRETRSEEIE